MGKKDYWICENCSKQAYEPFPNQWWHFKHLLAGVGIYNEYKDYKNYQSFGNITFCSLTCLVAYLNAKFRKNLNPSSR